jgi:hypothetical protein
MTDWGQGQGPAQEPGQKLIYLVQAGTDGATYREVLLEPTTKAIDIIASEGLQGHAISKPGAEGGIFAPADNVYDAVNDRQKLYYAADNVDAGGY